MKVKTEYTKCDVCDAKFYKSGKELEFKYDGKTHTFDCCYYCLQTNTQRIYKKITQITRGIISFCVKASK